MRESLAGRTSLSHRLRRRFIVLASIPAGLGWLFFGGISAAGIVPVCAKDGLAPSIVITRCLAVAAQEVGATEGAAFADKQVAVFSDNTLTASAKDYTATIDWGDGATSAGTVAVTFTSEPKEAVGTVKGSHTYAEEGFYDLTVTVDHGAVEGTDTNSSTVGDAPIHVTAGGTTTEGAASDAVVAVFTDDNPNAVAADFAAQVDCNFVQPQRASGRTASTLSVVLPTIVKNGNHFEVHYCRYADEASPQVQVTVTDKDGKATETKLGTMVVTNAALTATKGADISTTENGPNGPYVVATFTDANGAPDTKDFSAKINWGDGSADSNGTVAENGSGPGFQVSGFHSYHEGGSFTVTVTITDQDGADASTATAALTATVTDAPLHATNGAGATSTEGSSTGTITLATFTDSSDNEESITTYSATVDWKDGSTSTCSSASTTCTISFNGTNENFEIKSSHTYAEENAAGYKAHVTVTDQGGASATADDTIKVNDAALTAANGQAINVQQNQSTGNVVTATFTDANSNKDKADFTATIDWGDGKTSAGTVSVASGTFSVTGSHTYTGTGSFTVKTSITDTGSSTASATAAASVAAPPTLATTGAGWLIPPGMSGYAFLGGLLLVLGVLGWWAVLRDRFVWSSKKLR